MRSLDDDDVSFSDALGPTWAAVKHAVDSSDEGSFADFMLDAFRSYLVLHLSGERCAVPLPGIIRPSAEDDILSDIDETLSSRDRPRLSAKERTAFQAKLFRPTRHRRATRPFPTTTRDCGSPGSTRSLIQQVMALRAHRQSGRPVNDPRPPEWTEKLSHVYARMRTWRRSDEPSVGDYIHERTILLEMMVDVIPSGARIACARWATLVSF